MSVKTAIEWAEATWNPITGCTRVSEGCDHCYIVRTPPFRTKGRTFDGEGPGSTTGVTLHADRLTMPMKVRRPTRWFVNSLSDLFHEDVPDEVIQNVFFTMAVADWHEFLILTKRPARMAARVRALAERAAPNPSPLFDAWPLPNVWLGVSVESQKWADVRIPKLLETPAAVRFLSCEPLLGPVDIGIVRSPIDWVIVGGESGPSARPMAPEWARSLRDQCQGFGIPFFFKQWGGVRPTSGGRELDGRTWDEFPKRGA